MAAPARGSAGNLQTAHRVRPLIVLISCSLLVGGAGCWSSVEANCRGCRVVDASTGPPALTLRADTRTLVVLVHGAFGFGSEWAPVLDALRAAPATEFVAYRWPGGWGGLYGPAGRLAAVLQRALDDAPPTLTEVLVVAHSAGGVITQIAAGALRVRPGLRLTVVSVAAPSYLRIEPFADAPEVNTPLGFAITDSRVNVEGVRLDRNLPPRVAVHDYVVADPSARRDDDDRRFVGAHAGHMASLGRVAVPLILQQTAANAGPQLRGARSAAR